MKLGDRIFHLYGYGLGMVLETDGDIVRVLWEDPTLSQWEDEPPRETFWTDIDHVVVVDRYKAMAAQAGEKEVRMFATNTNKGFSLTFSNGNTVSVQWGPGNYCNPEHESGRMAAHDAPMQTPNWSASTAEVAAWNSDGEWHNFGGDEVAGYLSSDDVAKFIDFVANNALNTTSPWASDEE